MLNIGLEVQQQIRGADGTLLWSGAQAIATSYIAISSEASAAFVMGEAALWDPATVSTGFIPRQETTAAGGTPASDLPGSLVLGIKRTTAGGIGTDVGFLGVVQEPVGPGKRGVVAGVGSLTSVLVTTGAIAVGTILVSSATIGLCAPGATKAATVPAYGTVLGICLKTNTTGATGTNSTSWAGILVLPG